MKMKYDKVYVLTPYNFATGGVELAHQLVDKINNNGGKAYTVYHEKGQIVDTKEITPEYRKYNINITSKIEDDPNSILIVPEMVFDWIYKFNNITIGCWWMSVNNRYGFKACHWSETLRNYNGTWLRKLKYIRRNFLTQIKNTNSFLRKNNQRLYHFYQSAYAQHHLYSLGFSKVLPLGDYINTDFVNEETGGEREDIILYNPSKGYEFTKKIIKANPDLNFIPLKGLSRKELIDLMHKAKIYIDFGNFPGKDRLARESILNGLAIITGKKGASFFFEDVPLPEDLKYDTKNKNISEISEKIRFLLKDTSKYKDVFDNYKKIILDEEKQFETQVKNFFFT